MKNISNTKIILLSILIFHSLVLIHASYLLFTDFMGFNIQYLRLVGMLIFTLTWAGIFLRKRIFALIYFSLIIFELLSKMFFGKYTYGDVFGDIYFPADIIFLGIVILLYKQIFGERST